MSLRGIAYTAAIAFGVVVLTKKYGSHIPGVN